MTNSLNSKNKTEKQLQMKPSQTAKTGLFSDQVKMLYYVKHVIHSHVKAEQLLFFLFFFSEGGENNVVVKQSRKIHPSSKRGQSALSA